MASKENQEAFNKVYSNYIFADDKEYSKYKKSGEVLQKAIDDLELYKKALDKACEELDDRYYCHRGIRIACDDNNCKMCIKECLLNESENQ